MQIGWNVTVEKQKWIQPQSKTKNYHIRKQPIIENPHNWPFKQEKKEVMKMYIVFKFLAD